MNAIVKQPWLLIGKRGVPGATLDLSFMTPDRGRLHHFTPRTDRPYWMPPATMQTHRSAPTLGLRPGDPCTLKGS